MKKFDGDMKPTAGPEAELFLRWYKHMTHTVHYIAPQRAKYWARPSFIRYIFQNDSNNFICRHEYRDCYHMASVAFDKAVVETVDGKRESYVNEKRYADAFKSVSTHAVFGKTLLSCLVDNQGHCFGDPTTVSLGNYDFEHDVLIMGPSWRSVVDVGDDSQNIMSMPGMLHCLIERFHV